LEGSPAPAEVSQWGPGARLGGYRQGTATDARVTWVLAANLHCSLLGIAGWALASMKCPASWDDGRRRPSHPDRDRPLVDRRGFPPVR